MTTSSSSSAEDAQFKRSLQLLQSSHANSARELREMLDEVIKQRFGFDKMVINCLSKRWLAIEKNFPGRAKTPEPVPEVLPTAAVQQTDEIISLINSPARTISDSVDSNDSNEGVSSTVGALIANVDDDANMKEDFADLNCCVCGNMMFTATNKLVECSACHALYHQECHKPHITDENASEKNQHNWLCEACLSKPSSSKTMSISATAAATAVIVIPDDPVMPLLPISKTKSSATSSRSSSSSSSSFHKQEQATGSSSSSNKHHRSKEHRIKSSSASSSTIITPAINVISAADKSSSSLKRSATNAVIKNSSRSSKHHKSSGASSSISSRRKSCK